MLPFKYLNLKKTENILLYKHLTSNIVLRKIVLLVYLFKIVSAYLATFSKEKQLYKKKNYCKSIFS